MIIAVIINFTAILRYGKSDNKPDVNYPYRDAAGDAPDESTAPEAETRRPEDPLQLEEVVGDDGPDFEAGDDRSQQQVQNAEDEAYCAEAGATLLHRGGAGPVRSACREHLRGRGRR